VLDPLVDGEDRKIAGALEPAMIEQALQAAQHASRPIAQRHHPVDEIWSRQMELRPRDGLAAVVEEAPGIIAQDLLEHAQRGRRGRRHGPHPPWFESAHQCSRP
jgi:hypothetical protein